MGERRRRPDARQEARAIEARQVEVQQDEIRPRVVRGGFGARQPCLDVFTVHRHTDVVADARFGQSLEGELDVPGIVLDEEDLDRDATSVFSVMALPSAT